MFLSKSNSICISNNKFVDFYLKNLKDFNNLYFFVLNFDPFLAAHKKLAIDRPEMD